DLVVDSITGSVERSVAHQIEDLDICAEHEAYRADNVVMAALRCLGHDVLAAVDVIFVVAAATDHRVVAGAAIEKVRVATGRREVAFVETVAYPSQRPRGQHKVLDVCSELEAPGAEPRTDAPARRSTEHFRNLITDAVDEIGIVALAAVHAVVAALAVELV